MILLAVLNSKKSNLWKLQAVKKVTNTKPSIVKNNLKKLQVVKKVTKSEKIQQKKPQHYTKKPKNHYVFLVVKKLQASGIASVMLGSYYRPQ
jgi:hypothetical protein